MNGRVEDYIPNPDDEVPKALRDEFFDRMKKAQSERVRAFMASLSVMSTASAALACSPARLAGRSLPHLLV